MRFPDGQRRQRRFPRQAPISAVAAFCRVSSEEAATGRPFVLTEPFPGEALVRIFPTMLSQVAARLAEYGHEFVM